MAKHIVEVKELLDGSGDFFIEIPTELLEQANLKENDTVNIQIVDGKILIQKVASPT